MEPAGLFGVQAVYDALRIRLQEAFGIQPSEETWQGYRVMAHAPEQRMLQMDEILTGLQEDSAPNGAMVCRRLISAFRREHPRSHANLQFIVQPLNAALQMPV